MSVTCITGEIKLTDYNNTLVVEGDETLTGEGPIVELLADTCIVKGDGGTLKLISTSRRQPCIGSETHDGMSYGRWSPVGCRCKKLILKNIHLILESGVPNFTIGAYGYEEYPEVVLEDGATWEAPEAHKPRILFYCPKAPDGSTKISDDCEYICGDEFETEVGKELRRKKLAYLDENGLSGQCDYLAEYMDHRTSEHKFKLYVDVLKYNLTYKELLDKTMTENELCFYRNCAIMGYDTGAAKMVADTECLWRTGLIGDVTLCKATRLVFAATHGRNVDDVYPLGTPSFIYKEDVDRATDDEIDVFYDMIDWASFSRGGRNRRECCKAYFTAEG